MNVKGKITKVDEDQHLVFGWFSMATDEQGNAIVDSQGDTILIEELEKAAYAYVETSRRGDEMHSVDNVARLVESCVFTRQKIAALGLPEGSLPQGWFGGFRITNDEVWEKVKTQKYQMFSIGGRAVREVIHNE